MTYKISLWMAIGGLFVSPVFVEGADQTGYKGPDLKADFESSTHEKYTIPADYKPPEKPKTTTIETDTQQAIKDELNRQYPNNDFEVTVDNGVVTLTGHVTSEQNRQDIEKKVKNMEEVERVENNLEFGF